MRCAIERTHLLTRLECITCAFYRMSKNENKFFMLACQKNQ